jgi:hypothetical protein
MEYRPVTEIIEPGAIFTVNSRTIILYSWLVTGAMGMRLLHVHFHTAIITGYDRESSTRLNRKIRLSPILWKLKETK